MKGILLLFVFCAIAVADTTCEGGTCTACGSGYLCVGGTNNGKIFDDNTCENPAIGCFAQSSYPCICNGCAAVNAPDGTCHTASCAGSCTPVPEVSNSSAQYGLFAVIALAIAFLSQRKRRRR